MGSLFRSEHMSLCQLFLQTDSAFSAVAELGELGLCQFRDLNPEMSSYQRKYVVEVKRCDEMERRIRFVERELALHGIPIPEPTMGVIPTPLPKDMNDLESKFEKLEDELRVINNSTEALRSNYTQLNDIRNVLLKVQILFAEGQRINAFNSITEAESYGGTHSHNGFHLTGLTIGGGPETMTQSDKGGVGMNNELKFLAGVVRRDRALAFERVLWRMCHGKVYTRMVDIEEEEHTPFKSEHRQAVFLVFFSGEQLRNRVKKICDGFRAFIVENCSESATIRADLLKSVQVRLHDMSTVIGKTQEHHARVLNAAALSIKKWDIQVLKLKSIFHTLNMFNLDITQKCLIAECWLPSASVVRIRSVLQLATDLNGAGVASIVQRLDAKEARPNETPPTYHAVNKFTAAFQGIVDSYGIANYREINPAPWTIITFPFLFALMFGDAGHGLIMLLGALTFIAFERRIEAAKIKDEIFNTFYGGRYVILLMGLFAIYTGIIYNDFYSKSLNLFGAAAWKNPYNPSLLKDLIDDEEIIKTKITAELNPMYSFASSEGPYPFGVDPVWCMADNRLVFLNSMKMKSSIIIGISQMFFGIVLSLLNHLHFGSMLDVFFVFIPQVLFLGLIFVYLCVQVILKWIFFSIEPGWLFGQYYTGSHCAPALLVGLINMFMFKSRLPTSSHEDPDHPGKYVENPMCYLQLWYPYQDVVEGIFITVAILAIPVMLLVKPIVQWTRARRGEIIETHGHGGGDHGKFNFGDVMVYQSIHTIEFALGCISHTASYLRLWALSLAHAQLSDVLWTMVLRQGLVIEGWPGAVVNFIVFWAFGIMSVGVLVLMEGLSAFLHALRLHWVEFQSKFYGGTGVAFEPFSFRKIIRLHEGLDD